MASLEGDNLVVFYCLSSYKIGREWSLVGVAL